MKKYAKNHFEEMTYNQKPFNSRRFHKELEEMEASGAIPFDDLNTKSWMMTKGNRGVLLVKDVFNNGDFYKRKMPRKSGWVYGSKSLYQDSQIDPSFLIECSLLSEKQLISLALKRAEVKRIIRKSDGKTFDVAMLSDWPKPPQILYSACIYIENGQIHPLCPEPTGKNTTNVRFDSLADLLLAQLKALK